ncbi:MAG: autotransporter outer membrane beta-barrel domain-containing protein [Gammaproteobacteria bacterium]|nr:autotransporter outer membrane beta-barrel domain-containing protein [Gammaproteobacteria bacterium]
MRLPARFGQAGLLAAALALPLQAWAQAAATAGDAGVDSEARIRALEERLDAQAREIQALRAYLEGRHGAADGSAAGVDAARLDALRARGASLGALPAGAPAATGTAAAQDRQAPVGQAPEESTRPPEVAQIFDQPGVLTPRGTLVLEPSLQTGYYSNDRVALIGYTVIPAILIGLIDVRQVKTTSVTAALAARYGVGKRFELEARVPYTYLRGDTVSREFFEGAAQDRVFSADGSGLGDIELTARYQFANKGPDRPFYVVWLRYKTRTGRDLFEVTTDCVTRCLQDGDSGITGTGLPLELPTGSGFASIQPGLTWMFASDPVVFFGSLSYLHNFAREDVSRTTLTGAPEGFPQTTTELLGEIDAGDIFGFNIGVGLALNDRAAISIGYDHSIVAPSQQNGSDLPGAVRYSLGTLMLGGTYRINDRASLNVALGAGMTSDTPDVTLVARLPIRF